MSEQEAWLNGIEPKRGIEFDNEDFAIIITALYYLYIDSKYEYEKSNDIHHWEFMKESHRLFEKILNERGSL